MEQEIKLDKELAGKFDILCETLGAYERLAVAFSGGVDSTLLLKVAHDVLGDDAVAVTGCSPSIPTREIEEARQFCRDEGVRHLLVETHEFDIEGFDHNPVDRCYHCKRELFNCIRREAATHDIWTIAEGSNLDDEGDYRPGFKAVAEMDIVSPLRAAGLTKADVRNLARFLGLSVWDKPAFACLNTRFAYGDLLTSERLMMVDKAEDVIRDAGFSQVRVRMQDETARIEVPPTDIERLASESQRTEIAGKLKELGFAYISLDLQGYRTGSMNETL
ncbi:MAG: ATP-dependent sacrificial sulfur transferase LarE [Eggerthellaceae bacterium]|nr:ATP-dependent sacrificial sulfur transferase LarE [Eggerthellaceae bacterium]